MAGLWRGTGRVVVAWNVSMGRAPSFWPGVAQGWYNKTDVSDLQKAIAADLQNPHSGL
jgi:hypothetical protein